MAERLRGKLLIIGERKVTLHNGGTALLKTSVVECDTYTDGSGLDYNGVFAWKVSTAQKNRRSDVQDPVIISASIYGITLGEDNASPIADFYESGVIAVGDLVDKDYPKDRTKKDNRLTQEDVDAIQAHVAKNTLLTGTNLIAADVDYDNKVGISDAIMLSRYIAGQADNIWFE